MDLHHFQFENKAREQHVADSSNHSLSLMNLLDCSVGLSPFCQSITNDVNVSVATSLPSACAPLKHTIFQVQTLFVLLETLSRSRKKFTHLYIKKYTCMYMYKYIFVYVHNSIFKYLYIYTCRHGHHNIRNGIVWAQTSHSTCTCTATLCG